ncbi:uncharacterized protein LOC131878434 isoform X1 [Tigriopus californicus]|uniref:uncharacterized protein LOC131878434 isoform X1 n=1 Tax=Tigriopus californicus TaxID=6832 RepID=UPI0027DA80BB|nr:uncharacterized protein LOC131878434 isoform X1 [Tigriopus californicus]
MISTVSCILTSEVVIRVNMALANAFGDGYIQNQLHPYHSGLYDRHLQSESFFPQSLQKSHDFQRPAQNRQGIFPALVPLGLIITLVATLVTAVVTDFVNSENNRIFLESQAAININPIASPVFMPPIIPTTSVTVRVSDIGTVAGGQISGRSVRFIPQSGTSGVITGTTNANGEFTTPVPIGIPYVVEVGGIGLITSRRTIASTISGSTIVMPISSVLDANTVVAVLTWTSTINDLDLAALTTTCDCLLNFAGTNCDSGSPGSLTSTLTEDTALGTDGIEILTIEGAAGNFLVFVNNPEEEPNFEATGAVVTVFSGSTSTSTNVPTNSASPINLFWLAGEFSTTSAMFDPSNADLMAMDLGTCANIITTNYG